MKNIKEIIRNLQLKKYDLMYKKGINSGKIKEIGEETYKEMTGTYFYGFPAAFFIKYLKESGYDGKCYDYALLVTLAIPGTTRCIGKNIELACLYGEESSTHAWVEKDGKVYDFAAGKKGLIFDKDYYYEIEVLPKKVHKTPRQSLLELSPILIPDTKKAPYEVGGEKRLEFLLLATTMKPTIDSLGNEELKAEFYHILETMNYTPQGSIQYTLKPSRTCKKASFLV